MSQLNQEYEDFSLSARLWYQRTSKSPGLPSFRWVPGDNIFYRDWVQGSGIYQMSS